MIESLKNPYIKKLLSLSTKKARKIENLFLVEGEREILQCIRNKKDVLQILYSPSTANTIKRFKKIPTVCCSDKILEKLSYRNTIIAEVRTKYDALEDIKKFDTIVALEGIEKPGNIGAILRSACATAVDAIFLLDSNSDIYSPNIIRSSLGTIFSQKIIQITKDKALSFFKENKIQIVSTTPFTEKIYTQINFKKKTALIIGSEKDGLSTFWLKNGIKTKIPMNSEIDSLNVAQATTIFIYEIARQRKFSF